MATRREIRADLLSNLPGTWMKLVEKCRVLPVVEADGSSECPFAERLYFEKEEAVLRVKETRKQHMERIDTLQKEIEAIENGAPVPMWASDREKAEKTPGFDANKWIEEHVPRKIAELKERILWELVGIDVIDELLAQAAKKKFPTVPRDQYGKEPGEKVVYDPWAEKEKKVQDFLEDR